MKISVSRIRFRAIDPLRLGYISRSLKDRFESRRICQIISPFLSLLSFFRLRFINNYETLVCTSIEYRGCPTVRLPWPDLNSNSVVGYPSFFLYKIHSRLHKSAEYWHLIENERPSLIRCQTTAYNTAVYSDLQRRKCSLHA